MAARHLSFYSSGDNSPIDSNPLVPCATGIRYIPKVQRPVLPPNLFDCLAGLGIVALIFGAFMLAGTLGLGPVPQ